MDLELAAAAARRLVLERFPDARAAWLAGSVVAGTATAGSDLDVTVLLTGPPAPFRESLVHEGRPVELFVHTEASLEHWIGRDRARRRPTLLRLLGASVVLLDRDGAGADWRHRGAELLAEGPDPATKEELQAARYGLTDLLDDLADARDPLLRAAIAHAVWQGAAELWLMGQGHWSGTAKWLVRELRALDADLGSAYAEELHAGLLAATAGDPGPLTTSAERALDAVGGRLWAGYRAAGAID